MVQVPASPTVGPFAAALRKFEAHRRAAIPMKIRTRIYIALALVGLLSLVGLYSIFQFAIRLRTLHATNATCVQPRVYDSNPPRLTAIIQSYNHAANIPNISTALVNSPSVEEIVVCEDGSSDGSLQLWTSALQGLRHFVVRSNNLHEMRAYNRAMRLADGEFILLLQDDDLLPIDDAWIKRGLELLRAYPDVGILGGYIGQLWDHDTKKGFEYGEQTSTHGGTRLGNTVPIEYIDPNSRQPFMYVECAWNAPLFIRRDFIRVSGGLNLDIAKRGEPGVWQDCVYAYEAWHQGFSVAIFDAPFERGVGGHGTATTREKVKLRETVHKRALKITESLYNRRRTHARVKNLNRRFLLPRTSSQ